jgi:group I intron endonuclease
MVNTNKVANDFYNEPVLSFKNPITNRKEIQNSLIGLSGIYQWFNPITGHSYVGCTSQLDRRFMEYTICPRGKNLKNGQGQSKKFNSKLRHAFIKYGINNFIFNILKIVDLSLINVNDYSLSSVNIINSVKEKNIKSQRKAKMTLLYKFEQEYFDLSLPEYNVDKIAGGVGESSKKSSTTVFVYKSSDTSKNGLLYKFDSITEVIKQIKIHYQTLMRYINEKAVYKNKFIFSLTELNAASKTDYTNSILRVNSPDSKRKAN